MLLYRDVTATTPRTKVQERRARVTLGFFFYITFGRVVGINPGVWGRAPEDQIIMDIQNSFPRSFKVEQNRPAHGGYVELSIYKVGDILRWEGYYNEKRISLYHNGYYWIVESFWRGQVCGYFRHYKEKIDINDVSQLVTAACFLIDVFSDTNIL